MSNLLKSKFLLGVMIALVAVVGVVAFSAPSQAAAANCSITSTLRVGSKGAQVMCLQTALGITADGSFGPKTKAAVVAFQKNAGLVADGIFGAKSRAQWMANNNVPAVSFLPPGCTSATGYSSVTGGACYAVYPSTLPAGCTSTAGFSSTTGASCATGVVNNGTYPAGCTSASGFSPTTGASCASGAVANQTGPVSAVLSSDNPASQYIIANQATADLLHVTFTGNGTINTVVLQRTGVSDQNTLANVYLYDGMTRLTDGFSFNNVGQLTMNGLAIIVSGSKTISVKADVANVTNASSLGITMSSFTAAGNSPVATNIMGNQMTYGVGNLATASLGINTVSTAATVNAGTSAYTVWSAPLQVNTRAIWLKGANFRMTGSAPADALGNMKLYVDGVAVGTAATLGMITGSNYAMFDFSGAPVSLSTGSHTVDLRADIVKGASYTVTVSLQQAADLVLYDPQIGVNIAVGGVNNTPFTANTAGIITIAPGSASVNVDPTFQAQTNIVGGATNIAIGKFKVHGYGEDVKVTTLSVTPILTGMTPVAAGLNNLTVYFNGAQVGSSQTWTSGPVNFNLGSQMIIPAGTDSYIEVRADLQNNSSINYTLGSVSVNLNAGVSNAQGQTSHTTLNFPGNTVVGTVLTVQTAQLAVSKNASYSDQIASPNTAGVKIGSFILQNQSTSETVRVTKLLVTLSGSSPLTNLSNLRTSETSGSGATPIQPTLNNTFSVDFTVPTGATKVIDIFADTGASIVVGTVVNLDLTQAITAATPTPGFTGSTGTAASGTITITDTDNSTAVAPSVITATINGIATVFNANAAALPAATGAEIAAAASGLAAAINNNPSVNQTVIATTNGAGLITVTSRTVGSGGNSITLAASGATAGGFSAGSVVAMAGGVNATSTPQISTLTPSGVVEIGDVFTAGIGGTTVSFTASVASVANVTAGLTSAWNSNPTLFAIAHASDTGSLVNLTATVLGANTFIPTASAANGTHVNGGGVTVQTNLVVTSIGSSSNVSATSPLTNLGQTITLAAGTVGNVPTVNSSSTAAQYVPSANGAVNATKTTFNFTSSSGPSTITELTFVPTGTPGAVASVTVNGLTAPVVGGQAFLTGLSIAVPNGGSGVNQDVFVTYPTVGAPGIGAVPSASTAAIQLTKIKYQSGGTTTTLSSTTTPALTLVSGPIMTLVGSRPTVTLGLPNGASGTSVSGLSVGGKYVADIKISADAQGDIKVNTIPLVFTGNAAGTTTTITPGLSGVTNLVIKNASGSVIGNYSVATAGGALQTSTAVVTFTSGGYQIAAGTSETFKVEVNVSAVAGASSSIATGITPGTGFTWTDLAGGGALAAGTGASTVMPNYPTSSVSMTN